MPPSLPASTSFTITYRVHYVFRSFARRKWLVRLFIMLGIFSLDIRSPFLPRGFSIWKRITSPSTLLAFLGHQEHFSGYKHRIYYSIFYPETKIKLNGFFALASDGEKAAAEILRSPLASPPSSVVKMEMNGKSFSFFLMNKSLSLLSGLSWSFYVDRHRLGPDVYMAR